MFSMRLGAFSSWTNRDVLLLTTKLGKYLSATSANRNSYSTSRISLNNDSKLQLSNMGIFDGTYGNLRRWLKELEQHSSIRVLSTTEQPFVKPIESNAILLNKEETRKFMNVFPDIVREITDADKHQPEDTIQRVKKTLQYTVQTGRRNRGLITVMAYQLFEKPELLTPENIRLAQILGWCSEIMNGFLFIIDDIIDRSETRRGAPCWYRVPGIGLTAFNDAMILENEIYFLIEKHLKNHSSYVPLLELFHQAILKIFIGQTIDSQCCDHNGKPKLDTFTMEKYNSIIRHKSVYNFYLPIALAMYLANMHDEEQHRQAKTILFEIGELFQIQNDFLDCFGDPTKTLKTGTDIQEGKCSWLAVVALQRSTAAQRKIMNEHYGRYDPESVTIIRQLYVDLDLTKAYAKYEEECYNMITTHIHQVSKGLHQDVFFNVLNTMYKRNC